MSIGKQAGANEKPVALVTGGNRGIGLDTARGLGEKGYKVVLAVRDPGRAEEAVATLRKEGVDAEAVAYDALLPATDDAVFEHLEKRHGRLDVLVNNAGVIREPFGTNTVLTVDERELSDTLAVNLFAVVRLTRKLLPLLEKSPAGRIVNVSSILGSLTLHATPGSPIESFKAFAYDLSKVALNAFTIHLADALRGTRIKVNSAHPGWVKTELGGANAPEEVAGSGATSVRLATLGADGPTGGFFYKEDALPW